MRYALAISPPTVQLNTSDVDASEEMRRTDQNLKAKEPEVLTRNGLRNIGVEKSSKQNLDALTGLRFFAAFAVVLYHFGSFLAKGWPAPVANLLNSGFVAVDFFYILSGFVLVYSYINADGVMRGTATQFWVARLARIYPAYLFAFLLAAPTNIVWSLQVNKPAVGLAKLGFSAASYLSLLQAWTPWTAWCWNFPAWSVSVEAFFYLCFPFLAVWICRFPVGRSARHMAIFYTLVLVAPILLITFHGTTITDVDRLANAVEYTPILRLPEFAIGMLLGRLWVLGFRVRPKTSQAISLATLLVIVAILSLGSLIPRSLLASGLLAPLFCVLILCLADGHGWLASILGWRPLVILGEASYGIYILQIPVSYLTGTRPPVRTPAQLVLYVPVLLVVALVSWRFVEAPMRDWIKKRLSPKPDMPDAPRYRIPFAGSSPR